MEKFLTVEELRSCLRIGRAHAYRLIQSREIPSYKIGRCVRIRRSDLETYLEKSKV